MMSSDGAGNFCRWCSSTWNGKTGTKIYHVGEPCPYVQELEFYQDGSVKRVVFKPDVEFEYVEDSDS